ncbi:unnamed protein product [Leptidea sinapis]|uniref:Uncharacterized protein n=1 Tax=Leptidea sinapis TaxID=189913 RepID=A0A5E4QH99_9NEOP|nr:unnamed protein product [Leptidea sinapis]
MPPSFKTVNCTILGNSVLRQLYSINSNATSTAPLWSWLSLRQLSPVLRLQRPATTAPSYASALPATVPRSTTRTSATSSPPSSSWAPWTKTLI